MNYDLILIRYGEISLKSDFVRNKFEKKLVENIRYAFKLNNLNCEIYRKRSRIYVLTENFDKELKILNKIFGIVSFSPVMKTTSDIDDISDVAVKFSKKMISKEKTFALRVSRSGNHDFTSQDVAVRIGDDIVFHTKAGVNLSNPDFELFIEIRDNQSYIYNKIIRGPGGLPLGSQGKVLSLITNKESFLAAWYLMRRGCDVSFVIKDEMLVDDLKLFSKNWFLDEKYYILKSEGNGFYKNLNSIAKDNNFLALVTNHSIFSDENLVFDEISELKKNLMISVLHPLISFNEDEIILKCKELGLFI